jgi:hypothetical protein
LIPSDALPDDLAHEAVEAVTVIQVFAIVEAEGLLIEVAEKMKTFDANVGSLDAALQERPKVLHAIGVNLPVHIASVAQTGAFAVCGSSLGSRCRNRGQARVIENYRGCNVRPADPRDGGPLYPTPQVTPPMDRGAPRNRATSL